MAFVSPLYDTTTVKGVTTVRLVSKLPTELGESTSVLPSAPVTVRIAPDTSTPSQFVSSWAEGYRVPAREKRLAWQEAQEFPGSIVSPVPEVYFLPLVHSTGELKLMATLPPDEEDDDEPDEEEPDELEEAPDEDDGLDTTPEEDELEDEPREGEGPRDDEPSSPLAVGAPGSTGVEEATSEPCSVFLSPPSTDRTPPE
jgi:hypothetical protein